MKNDSGGSKFFTLHSSLFTFISYLCTDFPKYNIVNCQIVNQGDEYIV